MRRDYSDLAMLFKYGLLGRERERVIKKNVATMG